MTAISVARPTDEPPPTTSAYAMRMKIMTAAEDRGSHRNSLSSITQRPARIAMLPPEIAMTWYVPASCNCRCISSSRPGTVADENRRHHGGGAVAPWRDAGIHGGAHG